ncbi:ATP-dependent (S)-NAD(P)H-hydrate dehydratase [Drechslerella stenobrocha 248]|uniref:ATP-dependent (S)-NAD(P)H-hydrate dehydratase n=1 Tax=Drechslerella stenobrocha 248 TaxID=1043628 RepID=W7HRX4_9PEZI|nr:ATP-dependent (S)-NAD(P)H-hydrate dehydratase [Drechslerella stenobrocha 248]
MAATGLSQRTREILLQVRKMIPPLLDKFHKGQMGRVAVVGGCEDYTGAPFFSANASALLGADLSHIICEPGAATVIKSYSPNLMVHPYLKQSNHISADSTSASDSDEDSIAKRAIALLDRLHVIVVGPGLGRDALMQRTAARIVKAARDRGMGIVVDADALLLVAADPALVRSYPGAVLTPNVVEFARLCDALGVDTTAGAGTGACERLAKELGGVTGGKKRSGGQGDTLTGCLGTFLAWKKAYMDRLWDHDGSLSEEELTALAAFGASAVTRMCSKLAFEEKGRHMQASDLQPQIQRAFRILFEDDLEVSVAALDLAPSVVPAALS